MDKFIKTNYGAGKSATTSKDAAAKPTMLQQAANRENLPWVEKYRPRKVDEIAFQTDVVRVLKEVITGKDLPHMLFYGPPGTGKTSAILAACRELFQTQANIRERVLELNASDERGIQVVREKVKTFAQHAVSSRGLNGEVLPAYKIIIMDEADSMTPAAQAALRRTMETQSKTTRFCLICNYISRIIDPLASRCSKFRFKPLPTEVMKDRLMYIAEQEHFQIDSAAVNVVIEASAGDMRRSVTFLQSLSRLKHAAKITADLARELSGEIPQQIVENLSNLCAKKDHDKVAEYVRRQIVLEGYSVAKVLNELHDLLIFQPDPNKFGITDLVRADIACALAVAEHNLQEGGDDEMQLLAVSSTLCRLLKYPKGVAH